MYIQYTMDQLCLPMDLEEDIPANHLVRIVNAMVNRLDDATFDAAYPGGGRNSYHPKMLTKVILYAYTQRIYSSRQIAKAVRENIMFMWIAGRQRPDFRTINRFRSERMREVLETCLQPSCSFWQRRTTCSWSITLWTVPKLKPTPIGIRLSGERRL
nr:MULTISPECIES: transposase [Paenibacillus]